MAISDTNVLGRARVAVFAAGMLSMSMVMAPPVSATEINFDTFPSTSQVQPLVAVPTGAPRVIGQAVVVPANAGVLTQFSLELAAVAGKGPITARAVVFPFDSVGGRNTGEPVYTSEPVTISSTALTRLNFSTGNLALTPGDTYLLGLTTIYDAQTSTNEGSLGLSANSLYTQGRVWFNTAVITDLNPGQAFNADSPGSVLTFAATFISDPSLSNAPPDWLQQVGLPASGECTDIDDASLNQGGAASGGWGKSWAQWMNGGLGGAVCTRSLAYAGNGRWVIRS
jgi:hypothetical protein